jgi:ATP-dependent exoDNAse (exonuclease V) beta subunit
LLLSETLNFMSPTATELEAAGLLSNYARVSDVLREAGLLPDFSRIPPAILERMRAIGTATHKALELLVLGRLDRSTIDPAVRLFFEAGERWLLERKPFVVACEETVCDRGMLIKGTLDLRVRLDGEEEIIDWKTSNEISTGAKVQICGYVDLQGSGCGTRIVHLKKDGTYDDGLNIQPLAEDHAEWLRASESYVYKRERKLLRTKSEEAA